MGYYYWDPTYILVVIGAVICMIASARVKGTFNKYSQLRSMSGMNGAQVAQRVLQAAGIYDVQVRHVSGSLTDHYDPRTKTVNLSWRSSPRVWTRYTACKKLCTSFNQECTCAYS